MHPHTLVFSPLVTLIAHNTHRHHWPCCCRTRARVSSTSTHSNPVPPPRCFTWPVSLLHQLAAESSLPTGNPVLPLQWTCHQWSFAFLWFPHDLFLPPWTSCMKTKTVFCLLSTLSIPSIVLDRKEALGIILGEWLGHQPLNGLCTQENIRNANRIPTVMKRSAAFLRLWEGYPKTMKIRNVSLFLLFTREIKP